MKVKAPQNNLVYTAKGTISRFKSRRIGGGGFAIYIHG
jgi:hypothetical protein